MAAPVYGKGYFTGVEIADETVGYGTLGTSEFRLLTESETLNDDQPYIENLGTTSEGAARKVGYRDRVSAGGTLRTQADYNNSLLLVENALGLKSTNNYAFPTDPVENTKSLSVVVDRHIKRYQFTGGVTEEFRLMWNSGDPHVFTESDFIFQKCTPSDTALQATTLPTARVLGRHMVFRIGDITDALAAGDALILSNFLLRVKNNFRVEYAGSDSIYILQPYRESQRIVTLEITALRYSDEDEIDAIESATDAGTQLQADFVFTGAGSDTWTIKIPNMYYQKKPHQNISGKNSLSYSAIFDCYQNDDLAGTPTNEWMNTVDYELELDATT